MAGEVPALAEIHHRGLTGSNAKLVIVENVYMYGDTRGKPMTEAMPYRAHTRKGKVRGEISKAAFDAHRNAELRVTAARGGNFFGPWGSDSTMGGRVFYPLLQGKPAQSDRANGFSTYPYIREGLWQSAGDAG